MTSRAALRRRIRILWRSILRAVAHMMHMRHAPEAIAWGFALGLFIAFTPTFGLQIILAIALATILKVSRPAALVSIWITNIVTVPPIYAFTYWVGNLFWTGPSVRKVYRQLTGLMKDMVHFEFYEIFGQFAALMKMGVDILVPMTIGGIIVGAVSGAISYPLIMSAVRKYRRFRRRRRKARRKHMLLRRLHLDRLHLDALHLGHHHKKEHSEEEEASHDATESATDPVPPRAEVEDMGREKT